MIRPPGFRGAAFGTAADGDGRGEPRARASISAELGIDSDWAYLRQVHGAAVHHAERGGLLGDGDAAFCTSGGLGLAVATADCLPVVLESDGAAGIAHAGWRGAAAGVIGALRRAMTEAGFPPVRAAIGPGIGPCCFEVGPEVAGRFPGPPTETSWGTRSIDLIRAIVPELEGLELWRADICTMCDGRYHSYRRDGTAERQVGVAWVA